MWQVRKNNMYRSPRHWIYFKATVSILCLYFFDTPAQIQGPFLYTSLLNYIPPPHSLIHLLIFLLIFRLFTSNAWYFRSWPYSCPLTLVNSHQTPTLYVPCWVIYQKFDLYWKIWNFFWNSIWIHVLGHTHCIVNTQIRTRLLSPLPHVITHKPISWKKVQITINSKKGCWHLIRGRCIQKYRQEYSLNFWT